MSLQLKDLKAGDVVEVVGFNEGDSVYKKKLLSLGLTPGATITVLRVAPLGDPMEIAVRGFQLSLRKNEADIIQVKRA